MGSGGGAAPPQLNTGAMQNQQQSTNLQTAVGQAALNNVNQVTPGGSLTYTQTGGTDLGNGMSVPQYTATQSLTPASQAIFNSQQNVQQGALNLGQGALGAANTALSQPYNTTTSLSPLPTDQTASTNAAYNSLMSRFNQDYSTQMDQQKTQLANQGIAAGTDAYNNAMLPLQRSAVDASNQATIQATGLAGQNLNQATQLQNQQITDMTQQRTQPLNELATLAGLGSGSTTPSYVNTPQTQINPTDTQASQIAAYQGQMAQFNQQNAQNAAGMGGLFGLGGSALSAGGTIAGAFI